MTIKNEKKITDKTTEDLRAAFEHRATWFYLLLDEAEKKGLNWDVFARKAIKRCGCIHGDNKFTDTEDLKKFATEFASEVTKKIFEMEIIESTDEEFIVEFNHCPLVTAWMKLTDDEEKIDHLCDIAMDGDRGIISTFDKFEMDLQDTIARGGDVCRMVISKKN